MGRSIGAVIVGFLYALATIGLTQIVLWFAVPDEPSSEGLEVVPATRWILTVVCTFLSAFLAGFVAAYIAQQSELVHGLAVGAILVLLLAITTLVMNTESAPSWYRLALPGVALPGTLLGAGLRSRVRRPPPPAPPPFMQP
jgi:putative membrane protein (TIGR04086 family)